MRAIGIAVHSLLLAAGLSAEEAPRPDLSGTWIFNPARSKLEKTAPMKSIFWIEHQDAEFKLTRTHVWGESWDTLSFQATTDGEELYREISGFESWTRMFWQGEELVLDMRLAYRGEEGTNVVHYRLADDGESFIAAEWYHMPREQNHNLWIFDRGSEAAGFGDEERMKDFAEAYSAAWGSQDPDSVAAFFAEDGALRVNDGEPALGRDAIAEIAREFMTDLPDMVLVFDGLEGRGDYVHFYWTLEATNTGPGGTGNRVRVSGRETWRLDEDGLIAASQGVFPTAEYERQLEVGYSTPAPPD